MFADLKCMCERWTTESDVILFDKPSQCAQVEFEGSRILPIICIFVFLISRVD